MSEENHDNRSKVCAVINCKNSSHVYEDLNLFPFPKDSIRSKNWINYCHRSDLLDKDAAYLSSNYYVCRMHFEDSMFTSRLKNTLRDEAVPTIFNIHGAEPVVNQKGNDSQAKCREDSEKLDCSGNSEVKSDRKREDNQGVAPDRSMQVESNSRDAGNSQQQLANSAETSNQNDSECVCFICNFRSLHRVRLTRHFRRHFHGDQYHCSLCAYRTTYFKDLKQHMIEHDASDKKYKCTLCTYSSHFKSNIVTHYKLSHSDSKRHVCKRCDFRTNDKYYLKTHALIHLGEKPYACSRCNYRTSHKSDLIKHMRIHTRERPYPCPYCSYCGHSSGNLKQHLRTHSDNKPFACNQCNYRASHKSNLKKHLRTHTGERPYPCQYCDYRGRTSGRLKEHLRTHSNHKPFACHVCSYQSSRTGDLKRHMMTHAEEKKTSPCTCCDYRGANIEDVLEHMRSVHSRTYVKEHYLSKIQSSDKEDELLRKEITATPDILFK